jgi:hypothetical protein
MAEMDMLLRCAWDEDAERTIACEAHHLESPAVKVPCLACQQMHADEDGSLTARILRCDGLGDEKPLRPGSHAFVMLPGEHGFMRASMMAFEFGKACGHPLLSREEPVLFAGLLSAQGTLFGT